MIKFDPGAPVILTDPPAIVEQAQENELGRAESVLQAAINLDQSLAANAFVVGDLFTEIIENDYIHADNCETLADFLKKHNFELSKREIIYRTKISRISKQLGVERDMLVQAKISKVKAIFELDHTLEVTNEEDNSVIRMADIMVELLTRAANGRSLKDIRNDVDLLKSKDQIESEYVNWPAKPLRITKLQEKNFNEVIELGRKIHGDTVDDEEESKDASVEKIIEAIFEDFRSDPNNAVDEDGLHAPVSQFNDEAAIVVDGTEIDVGF